MKQTLNNYVIKVIGVGGCGHNNIGLLYNWLKNAEYISINSDKQGLSYSYPNHENKNLPRIKHLQIGTNITGGLGSGGILEVGKTIASNDRDIIRNALQNADIVFIIAGMGGGIGSGVTPIIASCAKEIEAITIGIVTIPFSFEGKKRCQNAKVGLDLLKKYADGIVIIDNDDLAKGKGVLSDVLRLNLADCVPLMTNTMLDEIWKTHRKMERLITMYKALQQCVKVKDI